MIVLTQLILAHLIGDFFLQTKSGVEQKEVKKWRSPFLYVHAATHFILILVVTWNPGLWFPALLIAAIHLAIDGMKLQLQGEHNRIAWFFGDQLLHLVTIAAIWYGLMRNIPVHGYPFADFYWIIIGGAILVTQPAGITIALLLSSQKSSENENSSAPLPKGSQTIGVLERLLVYTFILTGQWLAIAFVLLAKILYLFSAARNSENRKITNYLIIGTSLSFAVAAIAALGTIFLIGEALQIGLYL